MMKHTSLIRHQLEPSGQQGKTIYDCEQDHMGLTKDYPSIGIFLGHCKLAIFDLIILQAVACPI